MTPAGDIADSQPVERAAAALAMAGRFGLGPIAALSQFESFGNENWLLESEDGRRTVLRRYLHALPARVHFQLDLQQCLRGAGFPVATVLPAAAGQTVEADESGILWAAFAHVEGREYDFSLANAVQAARRLAEFHLLSRTLPKADIPLLAHRPSILECWRNNEEDVKELRALFDGVAVDEELSYLEGWWSQVRVEWPPERLAALPSGLVHGDFYGRNTAYSEGRLMAIFDFDDVEPGPFVQDVAGSAYKFARESRFSLTLRPEVLRVFLEAYASVRPVTAEEQAALPTMMAMTYPPNPRYYRYYRDHHGSDLARRLRREVAAMRAIREQAGRVLPA